MCLHARGGAADRFEDSDDEEDLMGVEPPPIAAPAAEEPALIDAPMPNGADVAAPTQEASPLASPLDDEMG